MMFIRYCFFAVLLLVVSYTVYAAQEEASPATQPADPTAVPVVDQVVSQKEAEEMIPVAWGEASRSMTLGTTTLAELMPSLATEAPPVVAWVRIVAAADELYANDPVKRAIYLIKAIKKGNPVDRLKALKLGPIEEKAATDRGYAGSLVITKKPGKVSVVYGASRDTQTLDYAPYIQVMDVPINGRLYNVLNFDADQKLISWSRNIRITDGGSISLSANIITNKRQQTSRTSLHDKQGIPIGSYQQDGTPVPQ